MQGGVGMTSEVSGERILETIKESGDRTETAIESLAREIRDLAKAITKQRVPESTNNKGTNNKGMMWGILVGVAGIGFGLMTPVYTMMASMSDNVSQHQSLAGHPEALQAIAALNQNLKEVETQFLGVREVIEMSGKYQESKLAVIEVDLANLQEWRANWMNRISTADAIQTERLNQLEKERRP
jgi:hypothetical protein